MTSTDGNTSQDISMLKVQSSGHECTKEPDNSNNPLCERDQQNGQNDNSKCHVLFKN